MNAPHEAAHAACEHGMDDAPAARPSLFVRVALALRVLLKL